jgi:hypothetical protein
MQQTTASYFVISYQQCEYECNSTNMASQVLIEFVVEYFNELTDWITN